MDIVLLPVKSFYGEFNTAFCLGAVFLTGVPVSTSVVILPFCHFIHCISVSPLHGLKYLMAVFGIKVKVCCQF